MNQTLTNLLLAVVAAGTGCVASSTNAVSEKALCAKLHRRFHPSSKEYIELENQAKENLARRSGVATDETTRCDNPFWFAYSGSEDSGLCPVDMSYSQSSLERHAIEAFLKREIASRTGESFEDGSVNFSQEMIPPVSGHSFGMYILTADSGSIYAAHRPVLAYGECPGARVICVQAVKSVGELEFHGCAGYTISKEECDRRYEEFNKKKAAPHEDNEIK